MLYYKQKLYLQILEGTTIVICGDTPLIRPETMNDLLNIIKQTGQKQLF